MTPMIKRGCNWRYKINAKNRNNEQLIYNLSSQSRKCEILNSNMFDHKPKTKTQTFRIK